MIAGVRLLVNFVKLLRDTLNTQLNDGMTGLDLSARIPEEADNLPTIVVSFAKLKEEAIGIGNMVEVKRELGQDTQIIRADRIRGEIIFDIWINESDSDVQTKIDQAAFLLGDLLEEHKKDFLNYQYKIGLLANR